RGEIRGRCKMGARQCADWRLYRMPMLGEPVRSPGLGPAVDSIQARLGSRYRIRGLLPWGHTVPYFRAEADGGPVVIATLPVDCQADPETEAAFLCAAFDFESLAGRGLPEI